MIMVMRFWNDGNFANAMPSRFPDSALYNIMVQGSLPQRWLHTTSRRAAYAKSSQILCNIRDCSRGRRSRAWQRCGPFSSSPSFTMIMTFMHICPSSPEVNILSSFFHSDHHPSSQVQAVIFLVPTFPSLARVTFCVQICLQSITHTVLLCWSPTKWRNYVRNY